MVFTHYVENETLHLGMSGDLVGDPIGEEVKVLANQHIGNGILQCVIDIGGVRYMNSNGIGLLITLLTKFRNKGGEVYLKNPSEHVQKLLVLTKLSSIFQISSQEEV